MRRSQVRSLLKRVTDPEEPTWRLERWFCEIVGNITHFQSFGQAFAEKEFDPYAIHAHLCTRYAHRQHAPIIADWSRLVGTTLLHAPPAPNWWNHVDSTWKKNVLAQWCHAAALPYFSNQSRNNIVWPTLMHWCHAATWLQDLLLERFLQEEPSPFLDEIMATQPHPGTSTLLAWVNHTIRNRQHHANAHDSKSFNTLSTTYPALHDLLQQSIQLQLDIGAYDCIDATIVMEALIHASSTMLPIPEMA